MLADRVDRVVRTLRSSVSLCDVAASPSSCPSQNSGARAVDAPVSSARGLAPKVVDNSVAYVGAGLSCGLLRGLHTVFDDIRSIPRIPLSICPLPQALALPGISPLIFTIFYSAFYSGSRTF
jgi:hypothetical protein